MHLETAGAPRSDFEPGCPVACVPLGRHCGSHFGATGPAPNQDECRAFGTERGLWGWPGTSPVRSHAAHGSAGIPGQMSKPAALGRGTWVPRGCSGTATARDGSKWILICIPFG